MEKGNIVVIKDLGIMGEVEAIDDNDIVTISSCDGSDSKIRVNMCQLEVTGSTQPHREPSIVHILGIEYKIIPLEKDDYRYDREADGWCDVITKEILLFNYLQSKESVRDLVAYQKKVLRHEIVHAFLYESGLWQNAYGSKCWAKNEEMVDWIAIQSPKIHKAFKEAGCEE